MSTFVCDICGKSRDLFWNWNVDNTCICSSECYERYQRDKLAEKEVSMSSISCIGDNCIHYNIGQGGAVCSIGEKNCTLAKREEKAVTVSDNTCTGNCNKCERTIISKDSTRSSEYECANCGSKFTSVNDHDSADTHYCCAECEYESMVTNNKYIHKCTCCGKLTDGLIHIDGEQLCKDCGFDSKGRASKLSDYECAYCGDTYIAAVNDEDNVDVHLCSDGCIAGYFPLADEEVDPNEDVKNDSDKLIAGHIPTLRCAYCGRKSSTIYCCAECECMDVIQNKQAEKKDAREDVAIKYDGDKPNISLVPPMVLMEVASVFTQGAKKYKAYNYRGLEYSRLYSAAMRHMLKWWSGQEINIDDFNIHHLSHAITSLMMLREMIERGDGVDDRS